MFARNGFDDVTFSGLASNGMSLQAQAMLRTLALALLLNVTWLPARAGPPVLPTKWSVDHADDHCEASRTFDIDGAAVKLVVKPPLDAGPTRLQFHRVFRDLRHPEPTVLLDFGDGGAPFRTTMHAALAAGGFAMIVDLPPSEALRLRGANSLSLKSASKVGGKFDMAPVAALFRVLDHCVVDLRSRIGIHPAPVRWTVPPVALTALGPLFSSSRFWTVEMRSPRTSKVTARLLIDKAGAVRDCAVTASSGSAGLDIQTCQVFDRMVKYRPARTATGEPVASVVNETINWRL